MNTENIINGLGNVEEMNKVAEIAIEATNKEFKHKKDKTNGFIPPKYELPKQNIKDDSSEGEKHSVKIRNGQGYVQDFESWVKAKIEQTKKDNK